MDADRFDSLAKRLVTPTTRRASLGALAAGSFLGALGLGRAIPETRAAQRRHMPAGVRGERAIGTEHDPGDDGGRAHSG